MNCVRLHVINELLSRSVVNVRIELSILLFRLFKIPTWIVADSIHTDRRHETRHFRRVGSAVRIRYD